MEFVVTNEQKVITKHLVIKSISYYLQYSSTYLGGLYEIFCEASVNFTIIYDPHN